jgi:hypothetical protein
MSHEDIPIVRLSEVMSVRRTPQTAFVGAPAPAILAATA